MAGTKPNSSDKSAKVHKSRSQSAGRPSRQGSTTSEKTGSIVTPGGALKPARKRRTAVATTSVETTSETTTSEQPADSQLVLQQEDSQHIPQMDSLAINPDVTLPSDTDPLNGDDMQMGDDVGTTTAESSALKG